MPLFDDTAPGDLPSWNPQATTTKKTTRQDLASDCQIGPLQFPAVSCSGGGARRLKGHGGIGVDGQIFEDLGEDARVENLKAEMDEADYITLDNIRRAGKAVTCVHPLFGSFQGRVHRCSYQAGLNDMVDVEITLVEDGDHAVMMKPVTVGLAGAAQSAKGAAKAFADWDVSGKLGAIDDIDDVTDAYSGLMGTGGAWDTFEDVLDDALEGTAGALEVAAEFGNLVSVAEDLIDEVDAAVNDATDLVASGVNDLTYALLDAARECVVAAKEEVSDTWATFTAKGPVSIAALAREWLGDDSDENIDAILSNNPGLIDLINLPQGGQILLPVV